MVTARSKNVYSSNDLPPKDMKSKRYAIKVQSHSDSEGSDQTLLVTHPENKEEMPKPVEYEDAETTREEGGIPARRNHLLRTRFL